MLAYGAVDELATQIADRVAAKICDGAQPKVGAATLLVFDAQTLASVQSYIGFVTNAQILSETYATITKRPQQQGTRLSELLNNHIAFVQGRIDSAKDADEIKYLTDEKTRSEKAMALASGTGAPTSLFWGTQLPAITSLLSAVAVASNTEIPGQISIPDSSLALAVTNQLEQPLEACASLSIVYPPLFGSGAPTDVAASHINVLLQGVEAARKAAHDLVISADDSGKKTSELTVSTQHLIAELLDDDGLYDTFLNNLLNPNPAGVVGSAAVVQGYKLASLLEPADPPKPTYVLVASVVSAGGTEHVQKTLWTLLTTGDRITYSGGAIVNFVLAKTDSQRPEIAQVLRYRSPFARVDDPQAPDGVKRSVRGDNFTVMQKTTPDASAQPKKTPGP